MLEKDLHTKVCNFIRTKYPEAIFRTDFGAGMPMSIGMARRQKVLQSHSGYPDLFIAEPRGNYSGLFLELKTESNKVFKKDGTLLANAHHEEQAKMLTMLYARGFQAKFAIGYEDAVNKIKEYLESD
jgi:hypothetical protein